jgi:hypothetical protein
MHVLFPQTLDIITEDRENKGPEDQKRQKVCDTANSHENLSRDRECRSTLVGYEKEKLWYLIGNKNKGYLIAILARLHLMSIKALLFSVSQALD